MTEFELDYTKRIELETGHGSVEIEGVEDPPMCIDGDIENGDSTVLMAGDAEIDLSGLAGDPTFSLRPEQFKQGVDIRGAAYTSFNHPGYRSTRLYWADWGDEDRSYEQKAWVNTDDGWKVFPIYVARNGDGDHPTEGLYGTIVLSGSSIHIPRDILMDYGTSVYPNNATGEERYAIHRLVDLVKELQEYIYGAVGSVWVTEHTSAVPVNTESYQGKYRGHYFPAYHHEDFPG